MTPRLRPALRAALLAALLGPAPLACHQEGASRRARADTDAPAEAPTDPAPTRATRASGPAGRDAGATSDARDARAPADGAPAREPDADAPEPTAQAIVARLDSGIVSKDLVGDCTFVPPARDLADRAARCAADPATCREPIPVGVVGFHEDGRAAVLSAPWLPACGEAAAYRAYEATLPFLHHDDESSFAPGDTRAEPPALAWIAKRLARGFAPPRDLARYACEYERWLSPVRGLTILREPLDRWMLVIGRGRRTLPVRLVGPSNKRVWDLDPIALRPGAQCEPDDKKKGACAAELGGEVVQLVLTPNHRSLIATIAIGTGERCATRHLVHLTFRLPDGVRSILPKPAKPRILAPRATLAPPEPDAGP